ncbi:hypothetical protein FSHL1_012887 [Fusarium sambucinum]
MFSTTKNSIFQKAEQLPAVATETPKARPTSSATMLNLATTPTMARANYNETKEHFCEAFTHFKLAFKGLFSVIANLTYLISEKREIRKQAAEKKAHKKNLERKKKLEEQLAKAEAQAGESKEEDKEKSSDE